MKVKVYEKVAEIEVPDGATHYLPYYDHNPLTFFKVEGNKCKIWGKGGWHEWRFQFHNFPELNGGPVLIDE